MFQHPVLRVLLCAECRKFYGDGTFEQGNVIIVSYKTCTFSIYLHSQMYTFFIYANTFLLNSQVMMLQTCFVDGVQMVVIYTVARTAVIHFVINV